MAWKALRSARFGLIPSTSSPSRSSSRGSGATCSSRARSLSPSSNGCRSAWTPSTPGWGSSRAAQRSSSPPSSPGAWRRGSGPTRSPRRRRARGAAWLWPPRAWRRGAGPARRWGGATAARPPRRCGGRRGGPPRGRLTTRGRLTAPGRKKRGPLPGRPPSPPGRRRPPARRWWTPRSGLRRMRSSRRLRRPPSPLPPGHPRGGATGSRPPPRTRGGVPMRRAVARPPGGGVLGWCLE
mmetsp:Transcript_36207/g.92484  ORF Transcript_36207/g.92484 Transcript_36207/m.92484 type:complete len:238 (+) Transcript_36207:84-797(+)